MKEEWLLRGAVVPVDVETTAALVAEIKRLIDVVGGMALAQPRLDQGPDYERGFIDGMMYQTQTSVDKAVNAMAQPKREWVGLTGDDMDDITSTAMDKTDAMLLTEAKLKELNHGI